MENILLKYLEERYKYRIPNNEIHSPGPVITISREFGCPANLCASDLADMLSKIDGKDKEPWKVISKEILEQSAKELGLTPEKIEFVFKYEKRSAVDEILEALLSKYYKSERRIKNTIREVIRSIGEQGRVIIVGRAGSSILRDVHNSLHIKLISPLDFRVDGVSRRHEITHSEAKKLTVEMDKKREQLRNELAGHAVDDSDYDLIFNSMVLKPNEIVEIITKAAVVRKIV